jgi:hypothetical protein
MGFHSGCFPVECPYCDSENFDVPQCCIEIDDGDERIVRCKDCDQFYKVNFEVYFDCDCQKISEARQEELQRRIRLAEHRAELEKMGQQDLPFEEMAAEEVRNVSKPKSA